MQTYPLTALYEARLAAIDEAERATLQRGAASAKADERRRDAEARLTEFRVRIQAQAQSQLSRAREGRASVADMQMSAAFRVAAEREISVLSAALENAQAAADECRRLLVQAQHQVEMARQELAIVERHRQNFLAEEHRTEQAKAEDDATELWQTHQSTFTREGSK